MHQQQHYTLFKMKKVKSQSTPPPLNNISNNTFVIKLKFNKLKNKM